LLSREGKGVAFFALRKSAKNTGLGRGEEKKKREGRGARKCRQVVNGEG